MVCALWLAALSLLALGLSPSEQRGRRIYREGMGADGPIAAEMASTGTTVSAAHFPCANCHGRSGEGTQEGGIAPPAITWSALQRRGGGEQSVSRAVSRGVAAMPAYHLSPAHFADLIAYLRILGTEQDEEPGVTREYIRIASSVPVTGALASLGRTVSSALKEAVAAVNKGGGVYGRRLDLVMADDPAALLSRGDIFAVVGPLDPAGSYTSRAGAGDTPVIGPVTFTGRRAPEPGSVFLLMPGFYDQARALVDYVLARNASARIAVASSRSEMYADARSGVIDEAAKSSLRVVADLTWESGQVDVFAVVRSVQSVDPDYVFLFGGSGDLALLKQDFQRVSWTRPLLSCTAMTAAGIGTVLADGGDPVSLARAAVAVFVEALRRTGRNLTRPGLIQSLEHLRDFEAVMLPPITFGPNRRIGVDSVPVRVIGDPAPPR